MKFQLDNPASGNLLTRLEPSAVWVNGIRHDRSVVVPWQGDVTPWPVASWEALEAAHFEALCALRPELVLFGSGTRLRFVHPRLLRALMDARIGVETMDLAAACRTYTVLASEGRRVLVALLIEPVAAGAAQAL